MVLNMFFQVALVPSLEITVFTSEFSLHFQVFTQNVSFEMGHNCEFFPAVTTGIPRISGRKKILFIIALLSQFKNFILNQ